MTAQLPPQVAPGQPVQASHGDWRMHPHSHGPKTQISWRTENNGVQEVVRYWAKGAYVTRCPWCGLRLTPPEPRW